MNKTASVAIAGLAALAIASWSTAPITAEEAPAGKEIFLAAKCEMCHSVPSQGITAKSTSEKTKGPDIAGITGDPTELASFLRKQSQHDGKTHAKEFKGTDAELKTLVAWVLEQKTQ